MSAPPPAPAPRQRLFSALDTRNLLILGARRPGLNDIYHYLVSTSWPVLVGWFSLTYVALNLLFALAFWAGGGVEGAHSLADDFFFSVQTFATVGYGVMHPTSLLANLLVTLESMLGLLYVATCTGLVFAKFSRPRARVIFSRVAVIGPRNGVPTLMFRVANERATHIVEAQLNAVLVRTEYTQEGERIRRIIDLPLVRRTSPMFIVSWTAMHPITPDSPLYGATPESLAEQQAEIVVTLVGLDDVVGQTIHVRHSYLETDLVWNARLADIIRPRGTQRVLDLSRFNDTEPLPAPGEQQAPRAAAK